MQNSDLSGDRFSALTLVRRWTMAMLAPLRHKLEHPRVVEIRTAMWEMLSPLDGKGARPPARVVVGLCLAVFLLALGARVLYFQDQKHHIEFAHEYNYTQPRHYQNAARRILDRGTGAFFDDTHTERGGARMLLHPPGYPLFIASVFVVLGDSAHRLRWVQIVADALTAVLLLLIAIELIPWGASALAAILVALSPQFAYNALVLQPDSIAVVPLLAAVLAIVHAHKRNRLTLLAVAGVLIGASCWIRSNALLLPFLLAVAVIPVLFPSGTRLRGACLLVLSAVLTIAPITIRNWIVFDRFIPLSLGAGITLIEGIADFDTERRFGFPSTDKEVALAEATWHNRPDYAKAIWAPDGIERDRDRLSRGGKAILQDPFWFSKVMVKRAFLMTRYNDDRVYGWPADTSVVPTISPLPAFGHDPQPTGDAVVAWSGPASVVFEGVNEETVPSLENPGENARPQMRIGSDVPRESVRIPVKPGVDYVVHVPIEVEKGGGSIQIIDEQNNEHAFSPIVRKPRLVEEESRKRRRNIPVLREVWLPFASQDASQVRILIRGASSAKPLVVNVGDAEVLELGQTPHQWLGIPRSILNVVQNAVYQTGMMRVMILLGIAILASAKRYRELLVLAALPLYYMCFQSVLHTEYRYILPIHYFLLTLAAIALFLAGRLTMRVAASARSKG